MRMLLRWLGAVAAGTGFALVLVALVGFLALTAWDRLHPPLLPGLEHGTLDTGHHPGRRLHG